MADVMNGIEATAARDANSELETGFGNIIIVDNLPVVPMEKFENLENSIRKICSQLGGVIKEDGLDMPIDPETKKTMGFCFIEFNTAQEAELAREKLHGFKRSVVNMFDDFDKYIKVSDQWTPPETTPYTPRENLQNWLTDGKGRDQFVIRAGNDAEVYWNDAQQPKPESVYKCRTESFVQWSPMGTYLATVHSQGVAVWGGATNEFKRLMRYAHPQVRLIDFSPGEKYLVTYSSIEASNPSDTNKVVINIFDVRTGKVMREFKGTADDVAIGETGVSWPVFKWDGGKDDRYFARMGKSAIYVYETETFLLVDKKSIKVENVMDFSWSPTDSILAVFVPELGDGNKPARVSLIQIPSKEELRQKNLFSVSDCRMYWQSNGEYLAVKVDRYTKTRKSTYTGFELFRIKERDIPIEVLVLENKNDKIIAFSWEPKGHRFAIIHGDSKRPDVSLYSMRTAHNKGPVSKLITLKGKQANAFSWSPSGRFIVLAGLKGLYGQLEFYDVDEQETMSTTEHFMATDIEWDPTGRYVATSSVHDTENGYFIWTFYGKLLYGTLKDHLFQFSWRPRPASFLTRDQEEEIAKNLNKYSKRYELEGNDAEKQLSEQQRTKRRELKEVWDNWVAEWKRVSEEEEEYETREVEVEEVVSTHEEVLLE